MGAFKILLLYIFFYNLVYNFIMYTMSFYAWNKNYLILSYIVFPKCLSLLTTVTDVPFKQIGDISEELTLKHINFDIAGWNVIWLSRAYDSKIEIIFF